MELVKSQEQRDQESVTIFAGLLLLAFLAVLGGVALELVQQVARFDSDLLQALNYAVLGCAGVAATRYIYRQR